MPAGGEGSPEATVSDEDEAAEMEDEAVRSRVQHKAKVQGGAVWGQPWGPPPSPHGIFALSQFSVAATQTLCPPLSVCLPISVSLCLGFWLSQCPPAPTSESNSGLPMAPRRTSSG